MDWLVVPWKGWSDLGRDVCLSWIVFLNVIEKPRSPTKGEGLHVQLHLILPVCLAELAWFRFCPQSAFDCNSEAFCQFCKTGKRFLTDGSQHGSGKLELCCAVHSLRIYPGTACPSQVFTITFMHDYGLSGFVLWTYLAECFACVILKTTKGFLTHWRLLGIQFPTMKCFFFHQR